LVLAGCANMSGIEPQARLRDASSLGRRQRQAVPAGLGASGGGSSATRSSTR
jgi:hypothetical protein